MLQRVTSTARRDRNGRANLTIDELGRALDPCPDLVLVDCFGTLLHRRLPTQGIRRVVTIALLEELDLAIAPDLFDRARRDIEREWAQQSTKAGGARDHRIDDLAVEMHRRLDVAVELDVFVRRFCALEVETETRLTRRNDALIEAIEAAVPPERLCVLSDTNLTEPMLRSLLESNGVSCSNWRVVTSCDAGESKRSGALYRQIAADRDPDERWVMIGDNPRADGELARAVGIEPLLVAPGRWDDTRDVSQRVLRGDLEKRVARILEPVGAGDVFPEYALTLYVFTRRLDRSLRSRGSDHAVFLAREGAFLQRLFDGVQHESSTPSRPALTSAYLLTSRKSTFVPALREPGVALEAFLNDRPSMTVRELLDTMSIVAWPEIAGRDDQAAATILPDILASDLMLDRLESQRREQGELLAELVALAAPGAGPVDLVDVGWRGTVRDQLARAMPDRSFRANLLGLVASSEIPATEGVLFANRPEPTPHYQLLSHFKELYELLLAADHGSVARYTRAADGSPEAEFDDDAVELAAFESLIRPFQDRCQMRFEALLDVLAVEPSHSEWLDELMAGHHARMMYRPRTAELDFVAQLRQRENFGASGVRSPVDTAPSAARARGLRRHVAGGGWPPLRMQLAGAGWQRVPYALYKDGQRRIGRLV